MIKAILYHRVSFDIFLRTQNEERKYINPTIFFARIARTLMNAMPLDINNNNVSNKNNNNIRQAQIIITQATSMLAIIMNMAFLGVKLLYELVCHIHSVSHSPRGVTAFCFSYDSTINLCMFCMFVKFFYVCQIAWLSICQSLSLFPYLSITSSDGQFVLVL